MIKVHLTAPELRSAATVAIERRIDSIKRGLDVKKHATKTSWNDWNHDINGAAAEMAVAKMLNVHWNHGVGTFKSPDVGDLQVRSTTYADGNLIVRPNDADESLYILVVCDTPVYNVIGFIGGADAKRVGTINEKFGAPAWFVPQSKLFDIEDLHR